MAEKTITGLDELQKFLDQLPAKIEANIMRSALAAGARVIGKEAKRNVPVRRGGLRASIRVSSRLKNGKVTASVKAGNKNAWYWRFVEFGTRPHDIKPKNRKSLFFAGMNKEIVHHPGARPHPFMRPALDSQSAAAIQAVGEQIKKRLTKQGLDVSEVDIEVEV